MPASATGPRLARIPLTRPQWIFLILLTLSFSINYIDRGSISVAGRLLEGEFHLDPEQKGRLYSAFFWTYMLCQPIAGSMVDRFNVNRIYAIGFLIWSGATLLTGAASGFVMLFSLRLLLGFGESIAYPSVSKILAGNFKEHQRGLANAMIDAGSKTGPAIGVLLGGLFMDQFGWRLFFYSIGGLSLLWLIPWLIWAPKTNVLTHSLKGRIPSIAEICSRRAAWGTFFGLLCGNYVWYFMVTWLPDYFRNERHYSQRDMAIFGSIPFWGVAASSLLGGFLSDRWIASGASPNRVRKTFTGLGLALTTLMLPAAMIKNANLSLALLTVACLSLGLFTSNVWALTQTLAGPWAAGRWTGLQNFVGNFSGILAPWLTGWIVKETGEFYWAFLTTTIFLVVGTICFTVVVPRVEPLVWKE